MKSKLIFAGVLATGFFFGAASAAAQSLNPIHWIKKGPTATEQLAANQDENKKLALQLQAILPPRTSLNDCVAALHVSHNLKIRFACSSRTPTPKPKPKPPKSGPTKTSRTPAPDWISG